MIFLRRLSLVALVALVASPATAGPGLGLDGPATPAHATGNAAAAKVSAPAATANRVRVADLSLSPAIAVAGEKVTVRAKIANESEWSYSAIEWTLDVGRQAPVTGKVAIATAGSEWIETSFTVTGEQDIDVTLSVDPSGALGEPMAQRADNSARAKLVVVPAATDNWSVSARKLGSFANRYLEDARPRTCVEGEVDASTLTVKRLSIATFRGSVATTVPGVDQSLALAFGKALDEAYKTWANEYTATVAGAYPSFAAWPGPRAPATPNVPFPLTSGGSYAGTQAWHVAALEASLKAKLGPAITQPGASAAVKNLARAASLQFSTWTSMRAIANVVASGQVPTFNNTTPTGAVRSGMIEKREPCSHLL
jgi:hypothetical protein